MSREEEEKIVAMLTTLADWKFPLSGFEVKLVVLNYLNKLGRTTKFCDNLPGRDWMCRFKNRHNLTKRLAENVKPARAEITAEVVNDYFDHLYEVTEDVLPSNIWNYDETAIVDDPGEKVCIVDLGGYNIR